MIARPGDNLFIPFECDYCCFFKLTGEQPNLMNDRDRLLMEDIRQANLDAFWSKATGTVAALHRNFWEQVKVGEQRGFEMFPQGLGPFPLTYDSGIRAAIAMLVKSLQKGSNERYVKSGTVRKHSTVHTKLALVSKGMGLMAPQVGSDRKTQVMYYAPSNSEFFVLS